MAKAITNNQEFLELIFGDQWPRAEVCSVPVLGRDDKYRPYWATQPAGSGLLARFNPDWNNYFSVGLVDTPGLRRIENFESLHVLVLDDVGPKVAPARVEDVLGEPTYRVETSPGNEHWGYVLDPPITDRTRGDALIDAAVDVLFGGKDPGMKGVVRIMRLPFGSNTKYKPPHRARLTHATGPRRDPADLERRLSVQARPKVQPPDPEPFDPFDAATSPGPGPAPGPAPTPSRRPVDPTLRVMRKLGLVLGNERRASQGTGWDVRCPWVREHTPSTAVDTGTMYFRGGGFKCWHGHCQDRTPEDVRARVNQMLSDETGGLFTIDDFDPSRFDAIDPDKAPPSPLPPDPAVVAEFWDTTVYHFAKGVFVNTNTLAEMPERGFNFWWAPLLRDYLPTAGKADKPITPAQWYMGDVSRRRVIHRLGWFPGQSEIIRRQAKNGTWRDYLNTWIDLDRVLGHVPDDVLDRHVRGSDWWALLHALTGVATFEDTENARRLLFYMAMVVGAVGIKPGHNPLFIGKQGAGKEQIWAPLMQVLGENRSITLSHRMFTNDFNPWMMNRLVLMPETRMTSRRNMSFHDQYENLKRMCDPGREWEEVNEKGEKQINMANVFVLVMSTNEDQPMALPPDDRRIWVIRVKETGWDVSRHQKLAAWLRAPSPWGETNAHAVVEWLIRYWDEGIMADEVQGHAPMTRDKQDLIRHGADPVQEWLLDRLSRTLPDPLTLPDIFSAQDIVNAVIAAVRSGTEALPPRTTIPHVVGVAGILRQIGCRMLAKGSPVATIMGRRRLWAKPDADMAYDNMTGPELAKIVDNLANRRAPAAFDP